MEKKANKQTNNIHTAYLAPLKALQSDTRLTFVQHHFDYRHIQWDDEHLNDLDAPFYGEIFEQITWNFVCVFFQFSQSMDLSAKKCKYFSNETLTKVRVQALFNIEFEKKSKMVFALS